MNVAKDVWNRVTAICALSLAAAVVFVAPGAVGEAKAGLATSVGLCADLWIPAGDETDVTVSAQLFSIDEGRVVNQWDANSFQVVQDQGMLRICANISPLAVFSNWMWDASAKWSLTVNAENSTSPVYLVQFEQVLWMTTSDGTTTEWTIAQFDKPTGNIRGKITTSRFEGYTELGLFKM